MTLKQTEVNSHRKILSRLAKAKTKIAITRHGKKNISKAFIDEFNRVRQAHGREAALDNISEIANNAAKNFLNLLCSQAKIINP